MAFSSTWDLEKYKSEFESDEHWQLRKNFMQAHKDKFTEDKLVCLARVFCNVEFLGCRYPEKTMKLVAELSKGVADDYREKQKGKLKRTFVQASDAAGAKIKGTGAITPSKITEGPPSKILKTSESNTSSGLKYSCFVHENLVKPVSLAEGEFPGFIIYEHCKTNCPINILTQSSQKNIIWNTINFGFPEEKNRTSNQERYCEITLNQKVLSSGIGMTNKEAKVNAAIAGLNKLRQTCYTIQEKLSFFTDGELVSKDNVVKGKEALTPLPEDNIGSRMMMKMGWTGTGLGKNQQGIKAPIEASQTMHRSGFGHLSTPQFHAKFRKVFQDYIASGSSNDLVFAPDFSADERKILHRSNEGIEKDTEGVEEADQEIDKDSGDDLFSFDSDGEINYPILSDKDVEDYLQVKETCEVCHKLESITGEESNDELFDLIWGTGSDTSGLINISEDFHMFLRECNKNDDKSDNNETDNEIYEMDLSDNSSDNETVCSSIATNQTTEKFVNVKNLRRGKAVTSFDKVEISQRFSSHSGSKIPDGLKRSESCGKLKIVLPDGSYKWISLDRIISSKELREFTKYSPGKPVSQLNSHVTALDLKYFKELREIFSDFLSSSNILNVHVTKESGIESQDKPNQPFSHEHETLNRNYPSENGSGSVDSLFHSRISTVPSKLNRILDQRILNQPTSVPLQPPLNCPTFPPPLRQPPFLPFSNESNFPPKLKRYRKKRLRVFLPDGSFKRIPASVAKANKELKNYLENRKPSTVAVTNEVLKTNKALRDLFPELASKLEFDEGSQSEYESQNNCDIARTNSNKTLDEQRKTTTVSNHQLCEAAKNKFSKILECDNLQMSVVGDNGDEESKKSRSELAQSNIVKSVDSGEVDSGNQNSIHSEINSISSPKIHTKRLRVTLVDESTVRIKTHSLEHNNYFLRLNNRLIKIGDGSFKADEIPPPEYSDSSDESETEWVPKSKLFISEPEDCKLDKIHELRRRWEQFIVKFGLSRRNPYAKKWQDFVDRSPLNENKTLCQKWKDFMMICCPIEAERVPDSVLPPGHELVELSQTKRTYISPRDSSIIDPNLVTVYLAGGNKMKISKDLILKHTSRQTNNPPAFTNLPNSNHTTEKNYDKCEDSKAKVSDHQSCETPKSKSNEILDNTGNTLTNLSNSWTADKSNEAPEGTRSQFAQSGDQSYDFFPRAEIKSVLTDDQLSISSKTISPYQREPRGGAKRIRYTLADGSKVRINSNYLKHNNYFLRYCNRVNKIADGLYKPNEIPPPEYSDSSSDESETEWVPKTPLFISEPKDCKLDKVHVLRRCWEQYIVKLGSSKRNPFAKRWQDFVDHSPSNENKTLCQKWKDFMMICCPIEAERVPDSVLSPGHELVELSQTKTTYIPPCDSSIIDPNLITVYLAGGSKMKVSKKLVLNNKSWTNNDSKSTILSDSSHITKKDFDNFENLKTMPTVVLNHQSYETTEGNVNETLESKVSKDMVRNRANKFGTYPGQSDSNRTTINSNKTCEFKAKSTISLCQQSVLNKIETNEETKEDSEQIKFKYCEGKNPNVTESPTRNLSTKLVEDVQDEVSDGYGNNLEINSYKQGPTQQLDSSESNSLMLKAERYTMPKKKRGRTPKIRLTLSDGSRIRIKSTDLECNKYFINSRKRLYSICNGLVKVDEIPPPDYSDSSTDEEETDWVTKSGLIITEPKDCEIDKKHILRKQWEQYILKMGSSKRNPLAKKWREFVDKSPVGERKTLCQKWKDFLVVINPNHPPRIPYSVIQDECKHESFSQKENDSSSLSFDSAEPKVNEDFHKLVQQSTRSTELDLEKHVNSFDLTVVHFRNDSSGSAYNVSPKKSKSKKVKNPNLVTAYFGDGTKIKIDRK